MFENFSFDAQPANVASPLYSPCTIVESDVSPFFKPGHTAIPAWTTGYATPPPSPPESQTVFRLRAPSITATLENLTIRERRTLPQLTIDEKPALDNVRFQRQVLSRLHVEEAQRRCLADLVLDMVDNGQSCSVSTPSLQSPTKSNCGHEDDFEDETKLSKSSEFRKSWTFGATQGCMNGGGCVRAGVQKKPRMRKSLAALSGDRMGSKRSKSTK